MSANEAPSEAAPARLTSIDAYRGFVMLLMMGEVLCFRRVAEALPDSAVWVWLAYHQSHVSWVGCSLHDMIQPSFSFLVGVALPFSLARRAAVGQPQWRRSAHAFVRALILILLGVFLRSVGHDETRWTFEDTLSQIGLGYGFLYLLTLRSVRVQVSALAAILAGYWLLFALYPLPGPAFDWAAAGAKPDEMLPGFAAHWSLNTNAAAAFDRWFLNLFPPGQWFSHNSGGYCTLSFIPTLGTMVLGLLAGGVLRGGRTDSAKVRWFVLAGLAGLGAGWLLGAAGVCPVVKKIWTPSWVLFSGGWSFLLLAGFYQVMDVWKRQAWALPLVVVGVNSIAAYLIAHLWVGFIESALSCHFGRAWTAWAGEAYEPFLFGCAVLLIEWLILYWMRRNKVFLRV
jgi:predicted acyltransferase